MLADPRVIALVAALLWSLSMVVAKLGLEDGGSSLQVSLVVAAVDGAVYWAILLFQKGTGAFSGLPPIAIAAFAAAGVVAAVFGRLASFTGIHRVGASINSAAISTRPFFATILAFLLLAEAVALPVVVGIVVLVAGLVLLSVSKGGDIGGWRPRELLFPVGAAAAFALADVIRRFGLTTTPATALQGVTLNETAGGLVLAAYLFARKRDKLGLVSRRTWGYFLASGLCNALSFWLLFVALQTGPVAVVSSLVATTPLFTTVFAYFLLGDLERITRGVVVGAVLVVVGAALITVGPALV